jgi:hypothetical protein
VLRQIEAVRKAWAVLEKLEEKLEKTPKGTTTREKKKYRKVRWEVARARSTCRSSFAGSSSPSR